MAHEGVGGPLPAPLVHRGGRLTSPERFTPEAGDDDLRREKARARELRQSSWWRRRVSTGVCYYCRRQVGARALTADHLVPLIRGGRSVRANLVPACKDCNNRKKSLLPWEWDAYLEGFEGDR